MRKININKENKVLRNVLIGRNVKIFNFVNCYDCSIDDGTKISSFVEIQKGVRVGKNCKVSSHSFICEGVRIEDNVFIGHNVTFINDKYPQAVNQDGSLKADNDWKVIGTIIEKGASIGSSATILCGVKIGSNSIVGAGSVVTKDVPRGAVAFGNPARARRIYKKKGRL